MARQHHILLAVSRTIDDLTNISGGIAFVMIAAAVVIINHMILVRMLGESVVWHTELSIYLVVAAFFLATPYGVKVGGHVAVELIFSVVPRHTARILQVCVHALVLAIAAYLALGGAEQALEAYQTGLRSTSLWGPPLWPVYAAMPVGLLLTCFQGASEIIKLTALPALVTDQ